MSKLAIVTGASSGIGRETAFALWEAGYAVVLAGRRVELLESAIAEANVGEDRALAVQTDISDPAAVDNLFKQARAKYNHLDVLFNNAGTNTTPTALDELSYEQFAHVIGINVTGTFLCTQAAFRWMKEQSPQGGRIINNGSLSAHRPRPHASPYNASKHAVSGLTKSTALEGRPYNIACGQIDIGNALTDMASKMQKGVMQADGSIATEPTYDAKEVARAVVHMASLPLDTNIYTMTIMATNMPYVGRG